MLNVLGLVYTLENKNKEALECYLESLATAEVMRSSDLKAISYSNIASCYQKMWNLLNYINIVLSGEERLFADDKFVAVM